MRSRSTLASVLVRVWSTGRSTTRSSTFFCPGRTPQAGGGRGRKLVPRGLGQDGQVLDPGRVRAESVANPVAHGLGVVIGGHGERQVALHCRL
jgi:hypothetical protein